MSGTGERFKRAGYSLPKALINVAGKPMVEHVIHSHQSIDNVLFIVNREHLEDKTYNLRSILEQIAPNSTVVPIEPHKTGPSGAILLARHEVERTSPVVVAYCDFGCIWDFDGFLETLTTCDGLVGTYTGFHPHMMRTSKYAYLQISDDRVFQIQEKQPFTSHPLTENVSSGTYGFRSGDLLLEAIDFQQAQNLTFDGELFTSLTVKSLIELGLRVKTFELDYFFQWGTPEDVSDFEFEISRFKHIQNAGLKVEEFKGHLVLLAAGSGRRFSENGYVTPKPLLDFGGIPTWKRIVNSQCALGEKVVVCRSEDFPIFNKEQEIRVVPTTPTAGQAASALVGLSALQQVDLPVTIASCDAMFPCGPFSHGSSDFPNVVVWTTPAFPISLRNPEAFSWIKKNECGDIICFLLKACPDCPQEWEVITGTFSFNSVLTAKQLIDEVLQRDIKINGEFYLDSIIEVALDQNLIVRANSRSDFMGTGSPEEYETLRYWADALNTWDVTRATTKNDVSKQDCFWDTFEKTSADRGTNWFKNWSPE
jgi:NDP-sugar pyrophosphorylase family protein